MGNILSRISEISKKEGISIGAMERKIGASKGVLARAILNGTDIQSKWIQLIVENYPQYSATWLLSGKGEMMNDTNSLSKSTSTTRQSKPIVEVKDETDSTVNQLLTLIKEQSAKIESLSRENGKLQACIDMITNDLRASGGGGVLHSSKTISPSMDSEKPSSQADNPQR